MKFQTPEIPGNYVLHVRSRGCPLYMFPLPFEVYDDSSNKDRNVDGDGVGADVGNVHDVVSLSMPNPSTNDKSQNHPRNNNNNINNTNTAGNPANISDDIVIAQNVKLTELTIGIPGINITLSPVQVQGKSEVKCRADEIVVELKNKKEKGANNTGRPLHSPDVKVIPILLLLLFFFSFVFFYTFSYGYCYYYYYY